MIGLKKEMEKRKNDTITFANAINPLTIVNISNIIKKSYNTTKRKIDTGDFTVEEALNIFRTLGFKSKSEINALEYLFTEQGE